MAMSKIQTDISPESKQLLKMAALRKEMTMGQVIEELVNKHLKEVKPTPDTNI